MNGKNGKKSKKGISDQALRAAFGALLIAAAVGLFLLSDAGRELMTGGPVQTAAPEISPAQSPRQTPGQTAKAAAPAALTPEAFLEGAQQKASGNYVAEGEAAYTIWREGLDGAARLELMLREGGVVGFTLVWNVEQAPAPPPEDASLIERDLYEARRAAFEREHAWFEAAYASMAGLLAPKVTPVKLEAYFALCDQTTQDGKRRTETQAGFSLEVSREARAEGNVLFLHFSPK